jgi:hypothetical protein
MAIAAGERRAMNGRLTSKLLVSSLLRRAQAEGGFGAVLARGDATSGAILVVLAERGTRLATLERLLQPDGTYAWQESGQSGEDEAAFRTLLARRRRSDPDLWIIELDVANGERFAAEMNAGG